MSKNVKPNCILVLWPPTLSLNLFAIFLFPLGFLTPPVDFRMLIYFYAHCSFLHLKANIH